jgi:hypothetical protein
MPAFRPTCNPFFVLGGAYTCPHVRPPTKSNAGSLGVSFSFLGWGALTYLHVGTNIPTCELTYVRLQTTSWPSGLEQCVVQDSSAAYGGGMYLQNAEAFLAASRIHANFAIDVLLFLGKGALAGESARSLTTRPSAVSQQIRAAVQS